MILWLGEFAFSFKCLLVRATAHLTDLYSFIEVLKCFVFVFEKRVYPAHRFVSPRENRFISFRRSCLDCQPVVRKCSTQPLVPHLFISRVGRCKARRLS